MRDPARLRGRGDRSPGLAGRVRGRRRASEAARWLLWELGQATGARPASIQELYEARGRGDVSGFTVPAINVRMMAYDTARAIFRAARAGKAGAIILEIARSEIAYTEQRPAEYVAVLIAAALREGYVLPLFIQGDHCQVNHKKYQADPEGEVGEVKKLDRRGDRRGLLQHRRRHLDAGGSLARRRSTSSSGSTSSAPPRSPPSSARTSPRASPSRSAPRSAKSA